ncbi:C40 family peptidase [Dactylosporangium matsuzakiense]|uniref:Lipoprotein n=1 Tax=Dactylosporangium matsuzakiense TaxID=53360 RepID=A0A9W6KKF7_9ACTN|nr:C40 family peptidase [Dactylosporangium matsuzakiense]GLL03737.1 lipoprotein [Dactylosporangium matsuzakiense]
MTFKALAALVAVIVGVIMLCTVAGAALLGGAAGCSPPDPALGPSLHAAGGGWPQTGPYRPEQVAMAATIVSAGAQMGVPVRGRIIAVATAIQESSLTNPTGGDQDSIGLFQQRPSQGWGTPAQLHDPAYASRQFYTHLLAIPNWQAMPLTDAAQAVQRSATPDAFAQWEPDATMLVTTVDAGAGQTRSIGAAGTATVACSRDGGDGRPNDDPLTLPADYVLPPTTPPAVASAIFWALGQLGTPYHFGGDCTAAHAGDPARQCDCSSLVQQAYRAAGITIPRTTTDQITAGTTVPDIGQILPGDLLFIPGSDGTRNQPGHVGMYLGDSLVIQAPHSGDVVRISALSGWAGQVSIIRRITTAAAGKP